MSYYKLPMKVLNTHYSGQVGTREWFAIELSLPEVILPGLLSSFQIVLISTLSCL